MIIPFLACFCFAHLKNVSNIICYIMFTVQETVCTFMLERKTGKMASHTNISIVILLDSVYPQIVKGQLTLLI